MIERLTWTRALRGRARLLKDEHRAEPGLSARESPAIDCLTSMTDARLSSFTSPASYWQASRAPRYSLLFALPLLVFYEVLASLQSRGAGGGPEAGLRNGADVILQSLFIAVAGTWGPVLFMACLIAVGLWLVVRDLHRHAGALR